MRARDHHDPIAREAALILCPGGPDDPDRHIEFHEDTPKGLRRRAELRSNISDSIVRNTGYGSKPLEGFGSFGTKFSYSSGVRVAISRN